MSKLTAFNEFDWINRNNEKELNQIISSFTCSINPDIEFFLKNNSIEFSKRKQSITYLVFNNYNGKDNLVGYFSLIIKVLKFKKDNSLSNTQIKKILRNCIYNDKENSYSTPGYLIAQIGKNDKYNKEIKGSDIMKCALNVLESVQRKVGGNVIYLESVNNEKVKSFYHNEGFKDFTIINKENGLQPMIKVF